MTNAFCSGCGTDTGQELGSIPTPDGCGQCPPEACGTCGGINHLRTGRMCSCWVSVEDMPLADVKAIFASDGTFNVDGNGKVTAA